MLDHARFLKSKMEGPPPGAMLPARTFSGHDGQEIDIRKWPPRGGVLVFLSETCPVCTDALGALATLLEQYPHLFVRIACDGGPEMQQETLRIIPTCTLLPCSLQRMASDLGAPKVPFVYCINHVGQVLAAGGFNDMSLLRWRVRPLLGIATDPPSAELLS